jgi:hypothetical protein
MINDVFAIIDWNKNKPLRTFVETLGQDACFLNNYSPEIILDKPEICLGAIKTFGSCNSWAYGKRNIVLHGKICGDSTINFTDKDIDFNHLTNYVQDGIYNFLIWDDKEQSLFISSDYLSAKALYYWRKDELVVISSNLKAFRLLPFIPKKLNPQVLATTLALSHPLSCDTLIEGVKTPPINCAVVFRRDKTEFLERKAKQSKNVNSQATEAELIKILDGLIEESSKTWLEDYQHLLISLSGGLDSRIALGYLLRLGTKITAATWGEPKSDDFKLGIELAEKVKAKYLTYIFTDSAAIAEANLQFPAWWTESFSVNNVPFYWKGWLDLLQDQGLPVVHGFLGGPLGGGRLLSWGVSPTNLNSEVNEIVISELQTWGITAAPNILTKFSTPLFKQHLTEGIAADLTSAFCGITEEFVYQRLMCLDFYYRQRRYLANAISKIIGTFLPIILPFYTKANLDFVLGLPLELILDRKIFRNLLLEEFPLLANVREADKGKLPVYSNRFNQYFNQVLNNRYTWYLLPQLKPQNSAAIFYSLLDSHLPIFTRTLRESRDLLDNYLDMEAIAKQLELGKLNYRERGQVMRLFNLCTFLNRYFQN